MPTANAVRYDTIWLRGSDYRVTPLNARFAGHVPELKRALDAGVPAYPDASRRDFYDVELPTGWVYIHVREDKRTVYLVAYSQGQATSGSIRQHKDDARRKIPT